MTPLAPTPATHPKARRLIVWSVVMAGLYALTWAVTAWLEHVLFEGGRILPASPGDGVKLTYALAFAVFFAPLLYLLPCALARRWLRPDPRTLLLYSGTAYFFGCGLELVMDRAFIALLGRPCYLYLIWPIHDGHTSGSGLVMWPLYGFFVCLLHQAIQESPKLHFLDGAGARAALLAVDAMALEVAANLFSLVFFGSWLFRYHAPDLHHFTTVEAFPIYLLGGYPGVLLLGKLEHHPRRGHAGAVLWLTIMLIAFGWEAARSSSS